MYKLIVIMLLVCFVFAAFPVTVRADKPEVGIGLHIGWPTLLGFSVKGWAAPRFGLQGMGSRFSSGDASLTMLSGRVFYKLATGRSVAPAIGVGGGVWMASDDDDEETVPIFEFLLHFEHKWTENFRGDYELGYYIVNFEEIDTDISGMALGIGMHYFF
ncbi:MAG: hypothetical protein JSV33_01895 [bacterium]|nr:MAG: hypothetical protein JSV33_01895 [bacterium]